MNQLWLLLFLSEKGRGVQEEVADAPSYLLKPDSLHPTNETDL
jgi:hypothetical protein